MTFSDDHIRVDSRSHLSSVDPNRSSTCNPFHVAHRDASLLVVEARQPTVLASASARLLGASRQQRRGEPLSASRIRGWSDLRRGRVSTIGVVAAVFHQSGVMMGPHNRVANAGHPGRLAGGFRVARRALAHCSRFPSPRRWQWSSTRYDSNAGAARSNSARVVRSPPNVRWQQPAT
jgi:hypothetical protein